MGVGTSEILNRPIMAYFPGAASSAFTTVEPKLGTVGLLAADYHGLEMPKVYLLSLP